jgi:hypothetical protein
MLRKFINVLILAGFFAASAAFADSSSACAKCHDADEFSGMNTADIEAGLRDTSIPPHKNFADLTDEQVQAIAAELSGS